MSNRLDQEREARLQPTRMATAIEEISSLGHEVSELDKTKLTFKFHDCVVVYFPYSGWATGLSIIDGRGLQELLKQLK